MTRFFADYEKMNPPEEQKQEESDPEKISGMSFSDVKSYFEAMKESLMNEMRKEIQEISGKKEEEGSQDPDPKEKQKEEE